MTVAFGVAQNYPCINMQELMTQYYYYYQEQTNAKLFKYRPRLNDDLIATGETLNGTDFGFTVEQKYPRLLAGAPYLGSPTSNFTDPPFEHFFRLHTNICYTFICHFYN